MSTILSFWNEKGKRRSCDARCYDGTGTRCRCICGGANHGAGFDKACRITRHRWKTWQIKYAYDTGAKHVYEWRADAVLQLDLTFEAQPDDPSNPPNHH